MIGFQLAHAGTGGKLEYRLFSPSGISRHVSGNPAVEQLVAKVLLTNPGTHAWLQKHGGGLDTVLGAPLDTQGAERVRTQITHALLRTEEEVRLSQLGLKLPPSEQLTRIDTESLVYDEDTESFALALLLTMADGNVRRLLLP